MSAPWSSSRLALSCAIALSACSTFAPPTNVHVLRTPSGDRAVQEEGTSLKLHRWDIALAREGLKRGYFVVKSDLEWRELWPRVDADKVPLLPFDLDFAREMLLVASPPSADAVGSEFKAVVEADRSIHVYVNETELGVDCPVSADDAAKNYDLVRVQRVDDKDVTYHVDSGFGPPCGKPPVAAITCKPDHSTEALSGKLIVEPATKVVCVVSGLESSRPVFDLTWVWDSIPLGSAAKIDVAKGSRGVTFVPEVIGTYRLALEVSDDLARKGTVTVDIDVPPPGAPLALQMVWTKLDANDDPAALPRVDLHALGVPFDAAGAATPSGAAKSAKPPPRPPEVAWGKVADCSAKELLAAAAISAATGTAGTQGTPGTPADKPAPAALSRIPWCTAKTAGSTTLMTLDPAASKSYALAVHYTDERVVGQPILCVRAYRDGKLQAERCDPDKRSADSWWTVGVIDSRSGKTTEMVAEEIAAAARVSQAVPDAGAQGAGGAASVPSKR
jgi:hypothetical protein